MKRNIVLFLCAIFSFVLCACTKENHEISGMSNEVSLGVQSENTTTTDCKAFFEFELPSGYIIEDVTDEFCSIVNDDGVSIGGIILTDMKVSDFTDPDSVALIVYLNSIVEGSEFFGWKDDDPVHPIEYISQYVPCPDGERKKKFYRVFFENNLNIYDMWFDLEQIDKNEISEFIVLVETKYSLSCNGT